MSLSVRGLEELVYTTLNYSCIRGVCLVQSTDFDVLLCVWGRTVRLTSRLDFQGVSVPCLDMCHL